MGPFFLPHKVLHVFLDVGYFTLGQESYTNYRGLYFPSFDSKPCLEMLTSLIFLPYLQPYCIVLLLKAVQSKKPKNKKVQMFNLLLTCVNPFCTWVFVYAIMYAYKT